MKAIVRKIDRALKRIYNLENNYWAERFLIRGPLNTIAARHAGLQGAIFVQNNSSESQKPEDISLGIYFSEPVCKELSDIRRWRVGSWSTSQLSAFAVASEEVSHFNYLIHNAVAGRAVSQLELELQGEIDKFLLAFFALSQEDGERKRRELFQAVFDQLFERFHWAEHLTEEQRERYAEANQCAQHFLLKCREELAAAKDYEQIFRTLRRFYRLSASEKISFTRA
jgi:hypothetical protein